MRPWQAACAFYGQYLKALMAFRWDFFLGVTGTVFSQVLNVVMISAIFARIPHLQGWRYEEILFIYGFSQLPLCLFYVFGSSLSGLNHLILDGHLDKFLIRPVSPLVQIMAQELNYQQFSGVITSIVILVYAGGRLGTTWSWWQGPVAVAFVAGGFLIFLGLTLLFGSITFWFHERTGLAWLVLSAADFAQYPVTLYGRPIRFFVTWVLPFAFTAFYPATLLLGIQGFAVYAWLTPLVGLACLGVGYAVWGQGLRVYASTGS